MGTILKVRGATAHFDLPSPVVQITYLGLEYFDSATKYSKKYTCVEIAFTWYIAQIFRIFRIVRN